MVITYTKSAGDTILEIHARGKGPAKELNNGYEWAQHEPVAREAGVRNEVIDSGSCCESASIVMA